MFYMRISDFFEAEGDFEENQEDSNAEDWLLEPDDNGVDIHLTHLPTNTSERIEVPVDLSVILRLILNWNR